MSNPPFVVPEAKGGAEKITEGQRKQEQQGQERLEQERLEQERLEQERLEQERLEQERLEQERLEQERLEQGRLEQERLKQEQLKQEQLKQEQKGQQAQKPALPPQMSSRKLSALRKELSQCPDFRCSKRVQQMYCRGYWNRIPECRSAL
ncbi:MAG: hypothetical protein LBV29_06140 [Azoarcus sp.]|nr:hypothetical protein [Azoarcus sp.]